MFVFGKPTEETLGEFREKCTKEAVGILLDATTRPSIVNPKAFVEAYVILSSELKKVRTDMYDDLAEIGRASCRERV